MYRRKDCGAWLPLPILVILAEVTMGPLAPTCRGRPAPVPVAAALAAEAATERHAKVRVNKALAARAVAQQTRHSLAAVFIGCRGHWNARFPKFHSRDYN